MSRPITPCSWRLALAIAEIALSVLPAAVVSAADSVPQDSPRRTAAVRLIDRCLPAVVAFRTAKPTGQPGVVVLGVGSGTIIHPSGYILTNHHVIDGAAEVVALPSGSRWFPVRAIASWAFEDLALVKIDSPTPLPVIPMGRSHDLMLGEPALVIGSPGGLAQSVSTGVISGLNRAAALRDGVFHPWMVQTSAAVSGGNSGGPLINALGEQVGVITGKKTDAENIGFAVGIDRVREVLPRMLCAQERYGFWLGLEVDTLARAAVVTAVAADSPGAQAGVRPGDVVRAVDKMEVRHGVDFHLALVDRKPRQNVELDLLRGKQAVRVACTLTEIPLAKPVAPEGLAPGLGYASYQGMWERLPDFDRLKPAAVGVAPAPALTVHPPGAQGYALKFTGFVKVPSEGLYTFSTRSDDGSHLYVGDRLVVDNDGLHGAAESAGMIRLAAGLHPLAVTYFQGPGEAELAVFIEGPGLKKQPLSPAMLLHRR